MKKALWIVAALLVFMVGTASSQERKYRFEFFGQEASHFRVVIHNQDAVGTRTP